MTEILLRVGGLIAIILLSVGGFLLWDNHKKGKIQELSYKEHEVGKLVNSGNYTKARELIASTQSEGGPMAALIQSYELLIAENSEEKVDEGKVLQSMVKNLQDRDLLSFYRERYAFYLFKQGKLEQALNELNSIREDDFNFLSATLLKAQILQKQGKEEDAKKLLEIVKEKGKDSYFANIAQAFGLVGE